MKHNCPSLIKLSATALLIASTGVYADDTQNDSWASALIAPTSVDIDLRTLPNSVEWFAGEDIKDLPRMRFDPNYVAPGAPKNAPLSAIDALMGQQVIASKTPSVDMRTVVQNFDGIGFTGVNPPDPSGDVGINYYIQSINGSSGSTFNVYNKSTGALAAGPINMETLGSGQCASGAGDPIVLFDEMADRWVLSEFSSSGNNLCVYVSKTSDPVSGGWHAYAFQSPTFPDYPKYGVGVDAYYVGTNESAPTVYALNRTAMLAGQSANFVRIAAPKLAGFGFQILQPVDHDGVTDMPAGTPGYFLRHRDDEVHNSGSNNASQDYVELWQYQADFNTTSNSSFTKVADIPVAEFDSSLCGLTSFSCFPQSGSNTKLDPLREVVMFRAQYRKFANYETIVGNFTTDVNGSDRGGIRWFELRRPTGGSWAKHQEGTYAPDTKNRWMGSIAMDKDGNTALAYSWGSSSDYPSLKYTGRLASDANGTMNQPEITLKAGGSHISSNRFGDYSHLALDPVDGCTFWFTNEYGKSGGQWGTHISSFKFDSCGGGTGNQAPTASFTNTCTNLGCSFNGSGSSDSDGSISSYAWEFGDSATGNGVNASHTYSAAGTYTVKLTVTDNQGATNSTTKSVTVSSGANQAPTASFTNACTNLACTFNGSGSTDSDGSIASYTWNFGDSSNGTGASASHTYGSAGTYNVTLTVTDNQGATHSTSKSVTVSAASGNVLQNGVAKTGLSGATNAEDRYTMVVPANATGLKFEIAGGTGDADIYVKFGSAPTTSSYDCRPYKGGNAETCSVTAQAGTYHVMVRAYSAYSGVSLTGSYTEGSEPPAAGHWEESNVSVARRAWKHYTITVPAGATSLAVNMSGGSGDGDLYVRHGAQPTTNTYDCRPYKNGNTETCSFSNPAAGTWHISVRGYSSASGINLSADW
jgi:PKD repeat protein